MRRLGVALCVLVVSMVLAGCGSSGPNSLAGPSAGKDWLPQDKPDSEPTLGPIPTITDPSQITRPIYRYLPTVEQGVTLSLVMMKQLNDCIHSHGSNGTHSWVAKNTPGAPTNAEAFRIEWKAELAYDPEYASLWGFFAVHSATTDGFEQPGPGVDEESTEGIPDSVHKECLPSRHLNGLEPRQYATPFSLPENGPYVPRTDSRWLVAVKEWRTCMAERGYPNAILRSENAEDTESRARGMSKTAETTLAVTDVQCKVSTNLVGKGVAIQSAYDQYYISKYQSQLNAFVAGRDKFLR